jgi:hypothetical protein
MGNCQVVPKSTDEEETFSDERIQQIAEIMKKRSRLTDNLYTTPSTFSFNVFSRYIHRWDSDIARKIACERAAKLAFPDKTYVITYDYPHGYAIVDMHISFVQFPDPFRQQLNPRGEPIGPSLYCSARDIPPTENEKEKEKKDKEKKDKENA